MATEAEALKRKREALCSKIDQLDLSSHELTHGKNELQKNLRELISHGVCYHISDLPHQIKSLLEAAMCDGTLDSLTSTTGLAEGVNFPVSCVIIDDPVMYPTRDGPQYFSPQTVTQMAGRAGRTGKVTEGVCFMMCKEDGGGSLEKALELFHSMEEEMSTKVTVV